MSGDDLLRYYNEELAFIRQLGAEFAEAHPKIAGRLRLNSKTVDDPHIARLIEAFALLNAKIRNKLEDDFPEIRDALLDILYPHYQAPIPSMAVVQLQVDTEKLMGKKLIPQRTRIISDERYGEPCQFMTCYPVTLWPISIKQAELIGQPYQAPLIKTPKPSKAVLRLSLLCPDNMTFAELNIDNLRFYINASPQQAYAIYELLFRHVQTIALADSPFDDNPIVLNRSCLQAVGFAEEEGMLPYEPRTFMGYRLLTEFFILPEKFLFFELNHLTEAIRQKFATKQQLLEVYLYCEQSSLNLEQNITAQSFALGCTPVVNLFEQQAEPIQWDQRKTEYHLIPDAQRKPQATEVYAIKEMIAINQDSKPITLQPFYGVEHDRRDSKIAYWYAKRKAAWQANHYIMEGSEVFLTFVNPNFDVAQTEKWTVRTKILCTNRDLAGQLPFGGGAPLLKLAVPDDLIAKLKCLTPFTACQRPIHNDKLGWQLISHLALNHLPLTNDRQGIQALKEILDLYDFGELEDKQNFKEGLLALRCRPITTRNPTSHGNVFWQGLEIQLEVDEQKFASTSLFLFSVILEHFLGLYCSINSFVQLVVITKRSGVFYQGKPRAGEKALI